MDLHSKMQAANRRFKEVEAGYNENRSKQKLLDTVTKRIQTAFIGAISACEDHFGYLWGIDEENPTAKQDEFLKLWNKLRAIILDNGNNQIRAIQRDLNNYSVNYTKRFNKVLPVRNHGKQNNVRD